MLQSLKLLYLCIFLLTIISCKSSNIEQSVLEKPVIDKTVIENFVITWKLGNDHITKLPPEQRKTAKERCLGKKVTLIQLDTTSNLEAKGLFRCIE